MSLFSYLSCLAQIWDLQGKQWSKLQGRWFFEQILPLWSHLVAIFFMLNRILELFHIMYYCSLSNIRFQTALLVATISHFQVIACMHCRTANILQVTICFLLEWVLIYGLMEMNDCPCSKPKERRGRSQMRMIYF